MKVFIILVLSLVAFVKCMPFTGVDTRISIGGHNNSNNTIATNNGNGNQINDNSQNNGNIIITGQNNKNNNKQQEIQIIFSENKYESVKIIFVGENIVIDSIKKEKDEYVIQFENLIILIMLILVE